MTGWGRARSRCITREQRPNSEAYSASDRPTISERSCPELKTGPFAAMTTTRAEGSPAMASNAPSRLDKRASDKALRRPGRSSVMVTTPSIASTNQPRRIVQGRMP